MSGVSGGPPLDKPYAVRGSAATSGTGAPRAAPWPAHAAPAGVPLVEPGKGDEEGVMSEGRGHVAEGRATDA